MKACIEGSVSVHMPNCGRRRRSAEFAGSLAGLAVFGILGVVKTGAWTCAIVHTDCMAAACSSCHYCKTINFSILLLPGLLLVNYGKLDVHYYYNTIFSYLGLPCGAHSWQSSGRGPPSLESKPYHLSSSLGS